MFFSENPTRRKVALLTAAVFAWLSVGPSAGVAYANTHHKNKGNSRALTPFELTRIRGAQPPAIGMDHALSLDPDSGSTYAWEGNVGGTNTGNGNKLTELPIVGWTARGGLPINFTIYHNSQGNHNSELGQHWTHSFDMYLVIDAYTGDVAMHWGNDLAYVFTKNIDGSFTAPTGIHDTLAYNSGTSTYTLTTKSQVKYAFTQVGSEWVCETIKDRNNNTLTINHNSSGFVTSVVDASSRTLSFSYNGSNQITSVTDPASRTFSFAYTSGKLTSVTFPTAGTQTPVIQYGYDSSYRITSVTDPRGKVWSYSYNSDGSLASETDPLSHSTTYSYSSGSTTITDANGNATQHSYSGGALSSVTAPGYATSYFSYDGDYNKTSVTDALSNTTDLTYDSNGNVLTVTDPLSNVTTTAYNAKNDPTSVTTPSGKVTSYSYDSNGNLTSVSDPLSHSTSFTVNSYGEVTAETNALSQTTSFSYDSYGNKTTMTDALSHTTTTAYNVLGMPTSITNATGQVVSTSYDNLGRTVSVTAPGSRTTIFAYNVGSLKVSQTNALSQTDTFVYDDAGRITSHTDALSRTVYFGYDAAGNKTSFTDGRGKVTYYSYTNRNQVAEIDYPDSTSQTYSYDANGQVYSKTDGRGVSTTYSYDAAGHVTDVDYSDSTPDVSFAYNSDGLKTSMVDGTGTTTYSYDNAFRLTSRAAPAGSTTYSYTNANQLSTRAAGGTTVAYNYDNAGRMSSTVVGGTQTTSYSYDNANRMTGVSKPDGSTESRTYDSTTADLTSVVSVKSGTTIATSTYAYDSLGRKISDTGSGYATSYTYDNGGQLTGETRTGTSAYTISYTYDNAGNRATKVLGGTTENYTYDDANKLTVAGGKSYSYDNAGNTTGVSWSGGSISLSWDAESRLKSETTGGTTVNYTFNGLGQRVGKSGGASASYILADDSIDSEVLSDGGASYAHDVSGLISENRGGTSKFYHTDALGSVRALTNTSGTVTDSRSTDAFGLVVTSSGSTPTPFGFAGNHGYQQDNETGLMRLGHRMYDASTGRFISRDPIQDGYNWYIYCDNDPLGKNDPKGEKWKVTDQFGQDLEKNDPIVIMIQKEIDKIIKGIESGVKRKIISNNDPLVVTILPLLKQKDGTMPVEIRYGGDLGNGFGGFDPLTGTGIIQLDPKAISSMQFPVLEEGKYENTVPFPVWRFIIHELGHAVLKIGGGPNHIDEEMKVINTLENPLARVYDVGIRTRWTGTVYF